MEWWTRLFRRKAEIDSLYGFEYSGRVQIV